MPPQTRREARLIAQAQQTATEPRTSRKPKRARARTVWLVVLIALIVLLAVAVWVGLRALTVKNELESAQSLVAQIQSGDADVKASIDALSGHAEAAASAASDPVWGALEWIPVAGDNLRGVRLAAQALDALVNDVAKPVLGAGDGEILPTLLAVAQAENGRISQLAAEITAVQSSSALIGPVRSGVDQVAEVTSAAAPAIALLPTLLGADGPRNYLLVFQNNAESLALGGSAAAQAMVHAEAGSISMGAQGDSGSYRNGVGVDVEVPQSAEDLYTSYLVDHLNTSMSRPDFPTAAQIMRAWWQRDIAPDQIDGVVSIDPLALARILKATGPIDLPTGDTLTSENAVSLLLNEVYKRWDSYEQPDLVDGFFAVAATSIFDKVKSGSFNIKDMLWAINESASRGSILVWSDDEKLTDAVAGTRASGILPTDNEKATTVGVYFNNSNGSKIDYYTQTTVAAAATCAAGGATFTVRAGISLPISQKEADALPRYVQSMVFGTTFRDWVYVYGPPGTTATGEVSVNGEKISVMHQGIDDLGRPVVAFEAWFDPGETVEMTATFAGDGEFGPLAVQTNPMINQTTIEVDDACR
ncbi:DUF4012 domain-containing protein [Microbacterium sp.]|uniref:DUF4012 domain-containing protein n=1 Tax=Microbacterium sp. TaxID=51671 RepID=UPI0039E5B5B8